MSLEDTLSNLSLYDAKKYFRKAQNVMLNYTEMEAKVREATNNEPWGASSTLMEQIAQGTYNIREREEILGMIFRRFTEKTASEWRQIYKSLQLLDYLIKHGSERFIDDVRTSLSLIKMLESFHYIDSQGRDQGINVRNKAQKLCEFLKDDNQIRAERKKAREVSKKFKGVAGGSAAGTNPKAGYASSRAHGISVSADFDSDDDDDYVRPQPYGSTTSDDGILAASSAVSPSTSSQPGDLFSFNDNPAKPQDSKDSDEDDDEFSQFQSAKPVTQKSGDISALLDVSSSVQQPAQRTVPDVMQAISTEPKKVDPFGSLFSTAKATKEPVRTASPSETQEKVVQEEEQQAYSEDDDIFGEITSNSKTSANKPSAGNNPGDDGEVELLSF